MLTFLKGQILHSITFVMDYVQFNFEKDTLTCFRWPFISKGNQTLSFGDIEYRNALCALITDRVLSVDYREDQVINIFFEKGDTWILRLENPEPSLPALMTVDAHDGSGSGWF